MISTDHLRENSRSLYNMLRTDIGLRDEQIQTLSPRDLLDMWLRHNGIIGYTNDIINTYEALLKASNRQR